MNISGRWKIRAKMNESTGKMSYRTTLVQRDLEGNTDFYTVFLSLVKEAKNKAIDDNQYIIVKPEDAWLGFYRKDKETQIIAYVKDFEYDESEVNITNAVDDDSLPF